MALSQIDIRENEIFERSPELLSALLKDHTLSTETQQVNMFNQGVKRVQDMLRENGNKEAKFDVSKLTVFCVDVFSNEDNITQTTTQTLSEVQIAILEYVHSHPNASRKEIAANINDITENGVKYHIRKLQKQGILKVWEQTLAGIGR